MTDPAIRDVPDSTLAILKARAAQAGKSLQAYALDVLVGEASRPTLAEIAARAEAEASASLYIGRTGCDRRRKGGTMIVVDCSALIFSSSPTRAPSGIGMT